GLRPEPYSQNNYRGPAAQRFGRSSLGVTSRPTTHSMHQDYRYSDRRSSGSQNKTVHRDYRSTPSTAKGRRYEATNPNWRKNFKQTGDQMYFMDSEDEVTCQGNCRSRGHRSSFSTSSTSGDEIAQKKKGRPRTAPKPATKTSTTSSKKNL
ncbi:unnamed protein product, partial [Nesidiocoris tenuis]